MSIELDVFILNNYVTIFISLLSLGRLFVGGEELRFGNQWWLSNDIQWKVVGLMVVGWLCNGFNGGCIRYLHHIFTVLVRSCF